MRPILLLTLTTLALTGCHTPSNSSSSDLGRLQAQYDAAYRRYQTTCFHDESDASIAAALHGPSATRPAHPLPTGPDTACTAARLEMDKYGEPLRAAMNAQAAR